MYGPSFNRSSISMPPDSHTQLANNCMCPHLFGFFEDIAFPVYDVSLPFPFFYGEYVVSFPSGWMVFSTFLVPRAGF